MLNEGDLARLARIERQLAREEPELAEALQRMRPPHGPPPAWGARLTLAAGLVFAVIALLLGSVAWGLLAAITSAAGWCLLRAARGKPLLPGSGAGPARRPGNC